MRQWIARCRLDERGAAFVEYALLLGLVAVIGVATITTLGQEVSNAFSFVASVMGGI